MKGIKLYALLGSLTVAVACVPTAVLADTPNQAKGTGDTDHPVFNEMQAGDQSRQMRLDQLFDSNVGIAASKANAAKTAAAPSTHSTNPAKASIKPAAASPATATPVVAKHVAPKAKGADQSQLAIYKSGNDMAALSVSHAVISNSTTPVIAASLDRPGTVPKYKAGDHMVIKLKALQDCNIMVFDYDNKGTITQLYPNDFDHEAALHSGQQVELGGDDSKYTLDVNGGGMEQIFVYAYPTSEKPIEVAMLTPVTHSPFRAAKMTRSQYDRLIAKSMEYSFTPKVGDDRSVSVKAKDADNANQLPMATSKPERQIAQTGAVQARAEQPANKIELVFQIEN